MPRRLHERSRSAPRLRALPEPVGQRDQLLGAVGADPDHHQQADLVLLQAHLQMDAVHPHVDVVGAGQRPLPERARLALPLPGQPDDRRRRQTRARAEELRERRNEVSLDNPCRYSNGSTSATRRLLHDQAGRIAEENRRRSPVVSSMRLSLTRGARTGTAPAAVLTSRSA